MTMTWEGIPEDCGRLALEADLAVTKCMACGKFGHRVSDCGEFPRCVHCHQSGHRVSECLQVEAEAREARAQVRIVAVGVSNWRRMLLVLGLGFLGGAAAAGVWWWARVAQ